MGSKRRARAVDVPNKGVTMSKRIWISDLTRYRLRLLVGLGRRPRNVGLLKFGLLGFGFSLDYVDVPGATPQPCRLHWSVYAWGWQTGGGLCSAKK